MTVYYVTSAASGGGAGTSGDPYTPVEAADNVIAGDKVWIKADAAYAVQDGANSSVMQITVVGTIAAPIEWEGYTTTTGDGGQVEFNAGTNSLTSAINGTGASSWYNIFKNIRMTGGSGDGFDCNGVAGDGCLFVNCRFDNNTGWGFQGDNAFLFINCTADNNGAGGIDADNNLTLLGCKIHTNTGAGAKGVADTAFFYNISYLNTVNQLQGLARVFFLNNSVDGNDAAGTVGLNMDGTGNSFSFAMNNIVMDCVTGINDDTNSGNTYDADGLNYGDYNLMYSNTADHSGSTAGDNDVAGTSDPFTDSAGGDYSLKTASEAIDTGTDGADA